MDLTVVWNGVPQFRLNARLAAQKGLSQEDVNHIKTLHHMRLDIEDAMLEEPSRKTLERLNSEWMYVNRALQTAWKFAQDDNFIRFWEVPHCTCPSMDNSDRYPFGPYITNCNCPLHGESDVSANDN